MSILTTGLTGFEVKENGLGFFLHKVDKLLSKCILTPPLVRGGASYFLPALKYK